MRTDLNIGKLTISDYYLNSISKVTKSESNFDDKNRQKYNLDKQSKMGAVYEPSKEAQFDKMLKEEIDSIKNKAK